MNKIFFLIFSLILCGCSQTNHLANKNETLNDERIVDQIIARTANLIEKEKGLKPCGSGGQMMNEVKMLALAFVYNQPIDIDQGRELLVYTVETFVAMINEDERIHSYLYNYPFRPKNVEIRIFINNPDNSSIEAGKLCIVSAIDDYCAYKIRNTKTGRLETIYKETFQEAKAKIKVN